MKRAAIIIAAIVALSGAGYSFYYFGIRPDYNDQHSLWVILTPSLILLGVAIALFVWATSDNIYNIKSGEVIDHTFTKAHMVPAAYIPGSPGTGNSPGTPSTYIPAHWVDDDWAICLKDNRGRTGWLHFSDDVFDRYPIGSQYNRPR